MIKTLDQKTYQQFLESFSNYHFIQSAEHNYQEMIYGDCNYIGFFEKEKPIILFKYAKTHILKNNKIALGSFGPIFKDFLVTKKIFHQFLQELKKRLKEQNFVFLQMYPVVTNEENFQIKKLLEGENLLHQTKNKFTWLDGTMIINLDKDLEEIFRDFRKDVKYNIKKAKRDGKLNISIHTEPSEEQIQNFLNLYEKQQLRKGFKDRAIEFYSSLLRENKAILFDSEFENQILSSIMAVKFESQKTLITYISASVKEAFKLKAPTLLRWELIKWAKENGYEKVDFFSLDKKTLSVSNFKRGFRPLEIQYPEYASDLIIKPLYYYPYQFYTSGKKVISSIKNLVK